MGMELDDIDHICVAISHEGICHHQLNQRNQQQLDMLNVLEKGRWQEKRGDFIIFIYLLLYSISLLYDTCPGGMSRIEMLS
jgi:hypothetical protein